MSSHNKMETGFTSERVSWHSRPSCSVFILNQSPSIYSVPAMSQVECWAPGMMDETLPCPLTHPQPSVGDRQYLVLSGKGQFQVHQAIKFHKVNPSLNGYRIRTFSSGLRCCSSTIFQVCVIYKLLLTLMN